MPEPCKIGFAGTDGRTLLSALVTSTAKSQQSAKDYQGVVVRGTSAMPAFCGPDWMDWPVDFLKVEDNTTESYASAILAGLQSGELDYVLPLPEALLFNGLVDRIEEGGFGGRIAGLSRKASFIEGDKAACKELCSEAGIPVAEEWTVVDAKSYAEVCRVCLDYIHSHGGAVLKYPYSAGGKGARVVLSTWEIKSVYDELIKDYKKTYKQMFRNRTWPLLIESRMAGVEISFTILVDASGHFQILPTSMDYPERFEGQAGTTNPITGGMGSISPHPFESKPLLQLVEREIAAPLVEALWNRGLLRPCVLYPGCFVSFRLDRHGELTPHKIRVCEVNIRPGEPEFQAVARRICNLGPLIEAMFQGRLHQVEPEIRTDQLALCLGLVAGPGGPDGQKGYPWSVTKHEPVEIDLPYLQKKNIQLIPSGMGSSPDRGLYSDGTRVAYLNANATVKAEQDRGDIAERLRQRLLTALDQNRVRVVPREDESGNRLAVRRDIGSHFKVAEQITAGLAGP